MLNSRPTLILLAFLLLAGCNPDEYVAWENVIPENKKAEAAQWLIDTVEAANPKSDEEPEDSIRQAEKTMIKLYGVPTIGIRTERNHKWVFVPYKLCSPRQQHMCNKYLRGD